MAKNTLCRPAGLPVLYLEPGSGRSSMLASIAPTFPRTRACRHLNFAFVTSCIVLIIAVGFAFGADSRPRRAQDSGAQTQPEPGRENASRSLCLKTTVSGPVITSIPNIVLVGTTFAIKGTGFTPHSVVNFFVATATGAINAGPLTPTIFTSTQLVVDVPASVPLGEGVAAVQVVNTDEGFASSNVAFAQLEGDPAAGIPSITAVNRVAIDSLSLNPGFGVDVVNTIVDLGKTVVVNGMGFDTTNGAAVDIFCACPGGKVGPFFLLPGDPGLTAKALSFTIPATGPNAPSPGPGVFRVTNVGNKSSFTGQSNSVAAILGARITINRVTQKGCAVTVNGTGLSTLTVINLFDLQGPATVNLGGIKSDGTPKIPLTDITSTEFAFTLPAGAVPGPAFVEAFNPPFVPFTSSVTSAA
jgi:hypothetical protein